MKNHANDAYPAVEACKQCVEAQAVYLYGKEYADESDAPTWEDADGWERELFRRRARAIVEADLVSTRGSSEMLHLTPDSPAAIEWQERMADLDQQGLTIS